MTTKRFAGTERYIATEDLMVAVNAAVTLARPLLIKGEPGTGKTQLAQEIALALGRPLHEWHIKSTTRAQQGLYEYDAVSRLRTNAPHMCPHSWSIVELLSPEITCTAWSFALPKALRRSRFEPA